MAKKVYDGPLNKHMDFTAAGPNGEPASGLAVQNYIKGIDSAKLGVGYTLEDGSAHLFFADEEDRDAYLLDPSRTDLIKDIIALEALYYMTAELLTPSFVPVFLGSVGNYIRFTFETVNKGGQAVSEGAVVTYNITRGSSTQTVTETYRAGTTVEFNADKYLLEGSNSITINIKGQLTKASTTIGVIFQVINLSLTDDFDISQIWDIESEPGLSLEVPYTVSGTGQKIMEWYVDGVQLEYSQAEDEITESYSERTKYIPLAGMTHGKHTLQFRVGVQVSGETFYSDIKYREFFVKSDSTATNKEIAVAANLPASSSILGPSDTLTIYMTQYEQFVLRLATWDASGTYRNTVTALLGQDEVGSVLCTEGEEATLPLLVNYYGNQTVSLLFNGESCVSFSAVIAQTSMDIHEITDALELGFAADGRTNASSNRDQWTDGTHTATFTGFQWTETSGWSEGRLLIPSGASLSFNYAPLAVDPANYGKTLEFEFNSYNVDDDDAVLCDITNSSGTGIKITATEITVKSRAGVVASREYKPDENIRVSIVINRRTGATNKGLLFVYFNGIVSMAANIANTDDFICNTQLSFGGINAGISLKQVRIYNSALPSDSILNNYMLYRDSVAEMTSLYDRNNLYETGTGKFDVNKIAATVPVMVITGNIPAIEATTDKKLQIVADIQYINLQDPSRSFTMKDAIMTGQGTSSMTYPKKNYRIYTRKSDATKVYDADGNEIESKLYQFKQNAQPVDCWCLKTDFAESSGTHNTGVARLWNDVLKNAQVNGEYVLRTEAQKAALEAGYTYDVRTTVDGFPIVAFYHLTEDDDLIFLGKFNFNNDKSTESVFGYTGIPGFDDTHVQCFEFLDSGNELALFHTVQGFDQNWDKAWESRYPDTKHPNLVPLKTLATWLVSTYITPQDTPEQAEAKMAIWQSEKADHFDLPKLASYYVYLMRHGAVDQTVKNSMITTEDGIHWFFELYDNDTIHGVRNDGLLRYGPEIDRQSVDPEIGGYAYAGHSDTIWNNFEADPECMALAKQIDGALFSAGLTYENVINMFNTEQAGKWAEKIYNQDAQYKYIGPWVNSGLNYLGSLQGSRADHRKWWLSTRFALYDALWVNGAYTGTAITLLIPGAQQGTEFSIVSGKDFYYGYGENNLVLASGVYVEAGNDHTFELSKNMEIGSPLRIYAPYYIESLDLSEFITYIGATNFNLSAAYSEALGSKMKTLILGVDNAVADIRRNNALSGLSGLSSIITLENLNIAGYTALLSLDLSTLVNLKTLKAQASGLTSVTFAPGSPLTHIELPSAMQVLTLRNHSALQASDIVLEDNGENIYKLDVRGCPNVANSPDMILGWLDNKVADDEDCEIYMDSVNWQLIDRDDLATICEFKNNGGTLTLRGQASLEDIGSAEYAQMLVDTFGSDVFTPGAPFYIDAPPACYISGPSELLEGESGRYSLILVGAEAGGTYLYQILSGSRTGTTLNSTTGEITTTENGNATATLTIKGNYVLPGGIVSAQMTTQITKRVYPTASQVNVVGPSQLEYNIRNEYAIEYTISGITGNMSAAWSVTGDIAQYVTLSDQSNTGCVITLTTVPGADAVGGNLQVVLTKVVDGSSVATKTLSIGYVDDTIAISRITNPYAMDVMVENNLINTSLGDTNDKMTKLSASLITASQINSGASTSTSIFYKGTAGSNFRNNCHSFNELQWFTSLTEIPAYTFYYNRLNEVTIPASVTSLGNSAFYSNLLASTPDKSLNIKILGDCPTIGSGCFTDSAGNRTSLDVHFITSQGRLTVVNTKQLRNITSTATIRVATMYIDGNGNVKFVGEGGTHDYYWGSPVIGNSVNSVELGNYAFGCLTGMTSFEYTGNLVLSGEYPFWSSNIASVVLPSGITSLPLGFLANTQMVTYSIPDGVSSIPEGCFARCSNLTTVTVPNSVTSFGKNAFANCPNLTTVNVPNSAISFGEKCFVNCTSLGILTIPNNIDIGENCFEGCSSLQITAITGATIRDNAFSGCTSLQNLTLTDCTVSGSGVFANAGLSSATVSGGSITGTSLFIRCHNLLTASITNATIGENAYSMFKECELLTTVDLTGCTMDKVPFSMCEGCTTLSSLILPTGITRIKNRAFFGCSSLTQISLTDSLTYIEGGAFCDCSSLQSLYFGSALTNISNYYDIGSGAWSERYVPTFRGTRNLSITLSENNPNFTKDGPYLIQSTGLVFVDRVTVTQTIPQSVTHLSGSYIFDGCTLPSTYTIGVYAGSAYCMFGGITCDQLILNNPSGNFLSDYAFPNCNIGELRLDPGYNTQIAYNNLSGAGNITSLYLGAHITSGNWYTNSAEMNFPALETVSVHSDNPIFDVVNNCLIANDQALTFPNTIVLLAAGSNGVVTIPSAADAGLSTLQLSASAAAKNVKIKQINFGGTPWKSAKSNDTFYNFCTNLENVDFGTLTTLVSGYSSKPLWGNSAKLKYFYIPQTLTNLGPAFDGTALTELTIKLESATPPTVAVLNNATVAKIQVPAGSLSAYRSASVWSGVSAEKYEEY